MLEIECGQRVKSAKESLNEIREMHKAWEEKLEAGSS